MARTRKTNKVYYVVAYNDTNSYVVTVCSSAASAWREVEEIQREAFDGCYNGYDFEVTTKDPEDY